MREPDCFLRYHMRCNAEFYYVGKIRRMGIGRSSLQRGLVLKWFYSPRAVETPLSGGKCALPSTLLVLSVFAAVCYFIILRLVVTTLGYLARQFLPHDARPSAIYVDARCPSARRHVCSVESNKHLQIFFTMG